ncbi:MAG: hypothetical protein GX491_10825 [Chloroflexi bacterium]|nr:hypothetical protein [Chloroflexota bacterium]
MESRSKPGLVAGPRTLFHVNGTGQNRLAFRLVLLVLLITPLACSGGFAYPAELTATALSTQQVISGAELEQSIIEETPDPVETPYLNPTPGSNSPLAASPDPASTPTPRPTPEIPILYYTQAGDTLKGISARFNVDPSEIFSPDLEELPEEGLFDPDVLLIIPPRLGETSNDTRLIPDSEVVNSPSALDLDLPAFIKAGGGYLSTYQEWRVSGFAGWHDGASIIERVSLENSINPRLLLAILEHQSHWVYGQPQNLAQTDYPIGYIDGEKNRKHLYFQLAWAVEQLNIGYYHWRDGSLVELNFRNGEKLRLAPNLNAGTVAVLYLYSRLYNQQEWADKLYGPEGLMTVYEKMFGNPWIRAQSVEPLFPATITQPPMELPYLPGRSWALTGGPHPAWGPNGAKAALDFAPASTVHGCYKSDEWVTAIASGMVVRSETGVVVLDTDGDGHEQTGWVILYLHIATEDRVPLGTWVDLNGRIGHPSCEGGTATGTHVHIARKYNGEWILADGPIPFVLSGWRAHAGSKDYEGMLTNGDSVVYASQVGSFESVVTRPRQ